MWRYHLSYCHLMYLPNVLKWWECLLSTMVDHWPFLKWKSLGWVIVTIYSGCSEFSHDMGMTTDQQIHHSDAINELSNRIRYFSESEKDNECNGVFRFGANGSELSEIDLSTFILCPGQWIANKWNKNTTTNKQKKRWILRCYSRGVGSWMFKIFEDSNCILI
jgi:hypothetical protein